MARRAVLLVLALALAGCGGREPTPEEVVRGWTTLVNDGDDASAAALFAPGARVITEDGATRLEDGAAALRFTSGRTCGRTIVDLETAGPRVTATFELRGRSGRDCRRIGERAVVLFEVEDGRIVLWHTLPAPLDDDVTVA